MMKKLYTLIITLAATLCLQAQDKKPNILLIISDDFSPKVFETNKDRPQRQAKTPNLDAFAAQSTVFENTHIMGSWTGAVCMASRTALNTGYSIWKANSTGKNGNEGIKKILADEESWSQLMKKAGYFTYMTGKWHVSGMSVPKIFDKSKDVFGGMFGGTPKYGYNRPIEGQVDQWDPSDPSLGGFWQKKQDGKHATEITADNAIDFLSTYKEEKEKPFFAYVAFNAPHDPRQAPKEYLDMYDLEGIQVPANHMQENPNAVASGIRTIRDENLASYPRTDFVVKTHMKEYFAIITHLDHHIGRVLKALDDAKFNRETIVIFTADHGLAMGEHGYLGKQNMYEASNRTPLFIRGGTFKAGTKIKTPIYMQDIMPTTLEIAGAEKPAMVDYKSLIALSKNPKLEQYDSIYAAYIELQKLIIKDGFKLIHYTQNGAYLLFDLNNDPEELHDLINDAKYAKKIEELKALLAEKEAYYKSLAIDGQIVSGSETKGKTAKKTKKAE
ncbi:MAG: sulfatase-like hydrolase/transferase [Opitutales bacterium]